MPEDFDIFNIIGKDKQFEPPFTSSFATIYDKNEKPVGFIELNIQNLTKPTINQLHFTELVTKALNEYFINHNI